MNLERPQAPNPYDYLPVVPAFSLDSDDLQAGAPVDLRHVHPGSGGENLSPHLRWSGFPEDTKSFAITCYDPDVPNVCGWWHWQVINIPADVTEVVRGAGSADGALLPGSAVQMRNDYGDFGFGGAGPPRGDQPHHYYWAVHALDTPALDLAPQTPNAIVDANLTFNLLARAVLVTTYQH